MNLEEHESLIKELASRYPGVVLDGAVDNNCWKDRGSVSKPRILWVLKDPNGDPTPKKEFPDLEYSDLRVLLIKIADAKEPKDVCKTWEKTYGLVAKVSYGLLHEPKCLEWGKWAENANDLRKVLHNIAVINIKKEAGGEIASPKELCGAVRNYGDIIFAQIKLLDPTVIILGNTAQFLFHSTKFDFLKMINPPFLPSQGNFPYFLDEQRRLWISAYHPNRQNPEDYYKRVLGSYRAEGLTI